MNKRDRGIVVYTRRQSRLKALSVCGLCQQAGVSYKNDVVDEVDISHELVQHARGHTGIKDKKILHE
jgi:hypothetical protein